MRKQVGGLQWFFRTKAIHLLFVFLIISTVGVGLSAMQYLEYSPKVNKADTINSNNTKEAKLEPQTSEQGLANSLIAESSKILTQESNTSSNQQTNLPILSQI